MTPKCRDQKCIYAKKKKIQNQRANCKVRKIWILWPQLEPILVRGCGSHKCISKALVCCSNSYSLSIMPSPPSSSLFFHEKIKQIPFKPNKKHGQKEDQTTEKKMRKT